MTYAKQSFFGRFAEKTPQYSGATTVFVAAVGLGRHGAIFSVFRNLATGH